MADPRDDDESGVRGERPHFLSLWSVGMPLTCVVAFLAVRLASGDFDDFMGIVCAGIAALATASIRMAGKGGTPNAG